MYAGFVSDVSSVNVTVKRIAPSKYTDATMSDSASDAQSLWPFMYFTWSFTRTPEPSISTTFLSFRKARCADGIENRSVTSCTSM